MCSAKVHGSQIDHGNSVENRVRPDCASPPDADFLFLLFPAHSSAISSCQHRQTPRCWVRAKKHTRSPGLFHLSWVLVQPQLSVSPLQQQVGSFRNRRSCLAETLLVKERKRITAKAAERHWELLQPARLCISTLLFGSPKIRSPKKWPKVKGGRREAAHLLLQSSPEAADCMETCRWTQQQESRV